MSEDWKPRSHNDWAALKEAERKGYEKPGTHDRLKTEEAAKLATLKRVAPKK